MVCYKNLKPDLLSILGVWDLFGELCILISNLICERILFKMRQRKAKAKKKVK